MTDMDVPFGIICFVSMGVGATRGGVPKVSVHAMNMGVFVHHESSQKISSHPFYHLVV